MIKRIFNTAFPFVGLLLGILIFVIVMDRYAVRIGRIPQRIEVPALADVMRTGSTDYVADEDLAAFERRFAKDQLYRNARADYQAGRYDQAARSLSLLLQTRRNDFFLRYESGNVHLKQKKYSKAIGAYHQALKGKADFTPALTNLAIAYAKSGRHGEAERTYLRALAIQPNNARALLNLAILYVKTENWRQSLIHAEKCVAMAGNEMKSKALYYMGMAYSGLEEAEKARKALNEAILLRPGFLPPRIQLACLEKDPARRMAMLRKVMALHPGHSTVHFYLAKAHRELNQLADAEANLQMALASDPGNEEIVNFLADVYLEENKPAGAERLFEDLLRIDALIPQNYFYLGKAAYARKDYPRAIELYEKAVRLADGVYPEAFLNQGLAYKRMGRNAEAVRSYRTSLAQKEGYFEAYYNLAILYQEMGDWQNSKDNYTLALQIKANFGKAWFNLGLLHDKTGDAVAAADCYRRVIRLDPAHLKALMNYAVNLRKQNKLPRAITAYENLLHKHPHYIPAWYNLAYAFEKNEEADKAIETYQRVLQLDPENTKAMMRIAELLTARKDYAAAKRLLAEAIDIEAANDDLHRALGDVYRREGDTAGALLHFSQAVQLRRDNPASLRALLEIYKEKKEWRLAAASAEDLYAVRPDKDLAYDVGRCYQRAGQAPAAAAWYRRAIGAGLKTSWVHYWLGKIHYENKEPAPAAGCFKQALAVDPDHKLANYYLAEIRHAQNDDDSALAHVNRALAKDATFSDALKLKKKLKRKRKA